MRHSELPDGGRTPHHEIDARLPSREEKDALKKISPTVATFTGGLRSKTATTDVANPPTDAQLDTAFGTPATVGSGFLALLDDDGAGTAVYLVASDGTNWWYAALTKAL
jgi:hypothetical protein